MFKKLKQISILLLYITLAAILVFLVYEIVKERYAQEKNGIGFSEEKKRRNQLEEELNKNERELGLKEEYFLEISSGDCAEKCKSFQNNPEDFQYCQNFCELSQVDKLTGGCENKSGLDKDYCLKDEALAKKNETICGKISDLAIRQNCQDKL